jgi:hypothetical protein
MVQFNTYDGPTLPHMLLLVKGSKDSRVKSPYTYFFKDY